MAGIRVDAVCTFGNHKAAGHAPTAKCAGKGDRRSYLVPCCALAAVSVRYLVATPLNTKPVPIEVFPSERASLARSLGRFPDIFNESRRPVAPYNHVAVALVAG